MNEANSIRISHESHSPVPRRHEETPAVGAIVARRGLEREAFIAAMRSAVTGVNVVTTDGPAGRIGLTVSAFASVSADPPTVLVCINRASPAAAAIRDNGCFCVNVLSTGQRDLADTFAGRPRVGRPYDFAVAAWTAGFTAAPRLVDALARFDCSVSDAVDAGSHIVFFGEVVAATDGHGSALLYRDRQYSRACTH